MKLWNCFPLGKRRSLPSLDSTWTEPAGTPTRLDWLITFAGVWIVTGLFIDAHEHLFLAVESFLNPWHMTMYSGAVFAAVVLGVDGRPELSAQRFVLERASARLLAERLRRRGTAARRRARFRMARDLRLRASTRSLVEPAAPLFARRPLLLGDRAGAQRAAASATRRRCSRSCRC